MVYSCLYELFAEILRFHFVDQFSSCKESES